MRVAARSARLTAPAAAFTRRACRPSLGGAGEGPSLARIRVQVVGGTETAVDLAERRLLVRAEAAAP
ncbi:MAG TPA: hypothetical protein VFI04_07170 [Gaiellaceae bacterium]|jgi:hypothetical protein|nr:hypothetical protein [Gaiellaceae bacterium]